MTDKDIRLNTQELRPSGRTRSLRLLQKGFEVHIQQLPARIRQIHKTERLHPSLGRPHWKQQLSFAANSLLTKMEDQFHFQLLLQRFLQMDDTAGDRKLMERTADGASVR